MVIVEMELLMLMKLVTMETRLAALMDVSLTPVIFALKLSALLLSATKILSSVLAEMLLWRTGKFVTTATS
jgi:hypothetical protein